MKEITGKTTATKTYLFVVIFATLLIFISLWYVSQFRNEVSVSNIKSPTVKVTTTPTPTPTLPPVPNQKVLPTQYHVFQTFNNCGPAALSMALHFYGFDVSQQELGQALRPYQIPNGDNDDKSVTLEELGEKAREYDLIPYRRPMGDMHIITQFIANDMPVIVRTWTKANEDIGHFRIIKGYDEERKTLIQDDSLQNKNLEYTYADFNEIWKKFNYEYLVLVPPQKQELAQRILKDNNDIKTAWQKAVANSLGELEQNPDDIYARFNLSVAYNNLGEYQRSVEEFEKIENLLPFRTLWYQLEPIEAYYQLGNYDKVLQITDKVLNNYNRAFSELYVYRGKIYQQQGNVEMARGEFEKAVLYNTNLKEASDLLNSL